MTATRTPLPTANPGAGIDYDLFLDCIHCGLCLSACPTYEELKIEPDSPRGRISLMRAVTDGRLPLDDQVRTHLDLCLDCRACESACPSAVQYHKLIEPFRLAMDKLGAGVQAVAVGAAGGPAAPVPVRRPGPPCPRPGPAHAVVRPRPIAHQVRRLQAAAEIAAADARHAPGAEAALRVA